MKSSRKAIIPVSILIFLFSIPLYAQKNSYDPNKPYYTSEDVKRMCGVPVDTAEMRKVLAQEDSMYKAYLSKKRHTGLQKTETIPNWQLMMSPVEDQNADQCRYDCWVHAATGIVEGQLHSLFGSNLGINLNENAIFSGTGHTICDQDHAGDYPSTALFYIISHKASSTVGVYPNFLGAKWGITQQNWNIHGIEEIKAALQNGPVSACFNVYDDFYGFFYSHRTAVYRWDHTSSLLNGHAVVIVSYYEDVNNPYNSYWLCKNSWGPWFADGGYFKIGFGECGIDQFFLTVCTVNQSCLAKIVPNLISSLNTAFSYGFVNDEWTYVLGNASANTNASFPPGGSLQVNSSGILTVASGVTLTFQSGSYLNVNGTLNANGSWPNTITFDRSGSLNWGGIVFNSGSSGSLSSCTIQHANTGIRLNGALPSISYCDISSNSMGIWLNNVNASSPSILGNGFSNNSIGIYCDYSSPLIDANHFTSNSFAGILCISSSPSVRNSSLYYGTYGLYLLNYSHPTVGNYNRIVSAGTAIHVETPIFVNCSRSDIYAFNQQYAVTASYSAIFAGIDNYWGQYPPNPANFVATSGAIIYWQPGNGSPWTGPLNKMSAPANTENGTTQVSDPPNFSLGQEFFDAAKLLADGKCEEAREVYAQEFKSANVVAKKYILGQLAECYRVAGRKDFTDFLNTEVRQNLSCTDELYGITLELENLFLIPDHNYQKAIDNLTALRTNFAKNDLAQKNALFNLGYIYTELLGDAAKGKEGFDELKAKYPDDMLTWQAKLLLGEIDSIPSSAFSNMEAVTKTEIPTSVTLLGNYPNPFNPSTTINYQLPEEGIVTLKVFDVLGREVATLVNDYKEAGYYKASFDASRLSSGIYFYKIQAGKLNAVKKMLLMK